MTAPHLSSRKPCTRPLQRGSFSAAKSPARVSFISGEGAACFQRLVHGYPLIRGILAYFLAIAIVGFGLGPTSAETLEKEEITRADLQRDVRNLDSAEQAFQSGFATEAEHYLSRIPPDSQVQSFPQKLELEVLLGFHRGDLPAARKGLRTIFKEGRLNDKSPGIFQIYLAEELILLRQFPAIYPFSSQSPELKWSEFQNTLAASQYPLFICEVAFQEGKAQTISDSPLDKHLQFSNALDFSSIRGRKLNKGDALQLQVLGALYAKYSVVRSRLDIQPEKADSPLRENLRLCREKLAGFRSQLNSTEDQRWLQEYLYRLFFAGWALDGSATSSFQFGDFLLRQELENRKDLEALHLFRRTLDQLLLGEDFRFLSHDEDKEEQRRRLHQLASVLRKLQILYSRLEIESDRSTLATLAESLEAYLFSDQTNQDFALMRRRLLDACGENRRNRESLVFLYHLSAKDKQPALRDAIIQRDLREDSRELLSVNAYRYGSLAQAMP